MRADSRRRRPRRGAADTDLSAWGPALIFPLLGGRGHRDGARTWPRRWRPRAPAPVLLFRTLGLYAAKSRVPFTDTPSLRQAIERNLRTIERATRDLEAFTAGRGCRAGAALVPVRGWRIWSCCTATTSSSGIRVRQRWNADGVRIVDELLVRGRSFPDGGFRRDPRDEQLTLWPTALAIYALVKAYENEELVKYESAAMRRPRRSMRCAPTTAATSPHAAKRKDPRANAYLAGALLLLFKDTGDAQYREPRAAILRWLTSGSAAGGRQDASRSAQVAYLVMLLDSLATQPYENILGRRPDAARRRAGLRRGQGASTVAARLRPPDFRYREMFDAVLHTLVERVPRGGRGHRVRLRRRAGLRDARCWDGAATRPSRRRSCNDRSACWRGRDRATSTRYRSVPARCSRPRSSGGRRRGRRRRVAAALSVSSRAAWHSLTATTSIGSIG